MIFQTHTDYNGFITDGIKGFYRRISNIRFLPGDYAVICPFKATYDNEN